MVGDIAGIWNLVNARGRGEGWKAIGVEIEIDCDCDATGYEQIVQGWQQTTGDGDLPLLAVT